MSRSTLGITQRKKRTPPSKLTVNPKFALQPEELAQRTHHRPAAQEAKARHSQAILGHQAKKAGKAKASARRASEGSWWLSASRDGFTAEAQKRELKG